MDGARQIVSLHIPGDFLDLQQLFLRHSDHSIQALTRLETVDFDRRALRELALADPSIGKAMWIDALVEASIYREWLTSVGRRDGQSCDLPMTQEQLGDAVGLTSVHVNRMLMLLTDEGIIERTGRAISFRSWERIRTAADFSALYLHLDLADEKVAEYASG